MVQHAKSFDDLNDVVEGRWDGELVMEEIVQTIEARTRSSVTVEDGQFDSEANDNSTEIATAPSSQEILMEYGTSTPPEKRENPVPSTLATPRLPPNERQMVVPAFVSGHDAVTPSPSSRPIESATEPVA